MEKAGDAGNWSSGAKKGSAGRCEESKRGAAEGVTGISRYFEL